MDVKSKGRPRKRPEYDHDKTMQEVLDRASSLFGEPYDDRESRDTGAPSINSVAKAMHTTLNRARKLLITAGCYSTEISRTIQKMAESGMTVSEIAERTKLSKPSVNSYLPYTKGVYNLAEKTLNADRAHTINIRKRACEQLTKNLDQPDEISAFWSAIDAFQGYPFKTAKGEHFKYSMNDDGMLIHKFNHTIPKATVEDAFRKYSSSQRKETSLCDDKLEDDGAPFLHSVFQRIGVVNHLR